MERNIKRIMTFIACIAGIEIVIFLYLMFNKVSYVNLPLDIVVNLGIIINCPMIVWRSNANKCVSRGDKGIILCMIALLVIPILDLANLI